MQKNSGLIPRHEGQPPFFSSQGRGEITKEGKFDFEHFRRGLNRIVVGAAEGGGR